MTDGQDIYNLVPTLFMSGNEEIPETIQEEEPKPKRKSSAKKRNASKAKEAKKRTTKKKPTEKKAKKEPVSVSDSTNEPVQDRIDQDRGIETASEEQVVPLETTSEDVMEDAPSEDPIMDDIEDGTPVPAFVGVAPSFPAYGAESDPGESDDSIADEEMTEEGREPEKAEAESEPGKPIEYVTDDDEIIMIRPSNAMDDPENVVRLCSMCGLPMDSDDPGVKDAVGNIICSTCIRGMSVVEREPVPDTQEEEPSQESDDIPSEKQDDVHDDQEEPASVIVQPSAEGTAPVSDPLSQAEPQKDQATEEPKEKGIKGIISKLKKRDAEIKEQRKARSNDAKDRRNLKRHQRDDNLDPDALSERLRRWYLWRFKGYVKLRTLSRMKNGEYKLETTLVKFKDLPREAVACTGEKGFYCHDTIGDSDWYLQTHVKRGLQDDDFTASDACNWMLTNKIDNALAVNWTDMNHVDFTKIALIVGVVLVIALVVITRM